jgi:spermidine synthase
MTPWVELGRHKLADGTEMTLRRRGHEYVIFAAGRTLMTSGMHGSEEALATLGCAHVRDADAPCVLVGGLGMGFTLRATLDALPAGASVVQAELLDGVVDWNRGPLGPLAGEPLRDARVTVSVGDVAAVIRASKARFDAILLDVDNGPKAFTQDVNGGLYGDRGLAEARAALVPGGVLAVWSAWDDKKFEHRLRYAGFAAETHHVRARLKKGGPAHTIFLGRKA